MKYLSICRKLIYWLSKNRNNRMNISDCDVWPFDNKMKKRSNNEILSDVKIRLILTFATSDS